jgi:hypothetical protein
MSTPGGAPGAGVPGAGAGAGEPSPRARLLAVWSWLMLPMLVVSFGVGYAVGVVLMGALGVPEGGLLTRAGTAGRLAALLVLLIGVLPTVGGVLLGRRAVREGAGARGTAALVVNGVVLAYLVVVQVLQQVSG